MGALLSVTIIARAGGGGGGGAEREEGLREECGAMSAVPLCGRAHGDRWWCPAWRHDPREGYADMGSCRREVVPTETVGGAPQGATVHGWEEEAGREEA